MLAVRQTLLGADKLKKVHDAPEIDAGAIVGLTLRALTLDLTTFPVS